MKNVIVAAALAGLVTAASAQTVTTRIYNIEGFGNSSGPVVNDTFPLPEVLEVVSIRVTISHSWLSDLEFVITAPDGDVYTPMFDSGGGDDLGNGAGFGLVHAVPYTFVAPGTTGFTIDDPLGNPRPAVGYDALTWGDGSPAGNWNVHLVDDAAGDTGSIGSLTIEYQAGALAGACRGAIGCTIQTEADCLAAGGDYLGDGTLCPTGACCTGVSCAIMTPSECAGAAGLYLGDDSDCAQAACDTLGACCLDDACVVTREFLCTSAGGTFTGAGTSCDGSCPPACIAEVTGDVPPSIDIGDLLTFLAAWFEGCP